jgi:hypothetical protein
LRSPEARKQLSAAGPRDAAHWSAAALMNRVVDLYAQLATAGSPRVVPEPAEAAQV